MVNKYTGKTVGEAFQRAKMHLGQEAMILSTQYIENQQGKSVEIVATGGRTENTELSRDNFKSMANVLADSRLRGIEDKINYLKESIDFLSESIPKKGNQWDLYDYLIEQEVEAVYAKKMINILKDEIDVKDSQKVKEKLKDILNDFMFVSTGIRLSEQIPKVVALVGPTGVGKTTTIAKIAAHFTFSKKLKVALITMDTFRVGAKEQLKAYGEIMRIPVEVANSAASLELEIKKHQDKDLILIDTTGRSQNNEMQIYEVSNALEKIENLEVHLTISLNTRYKDMLDIVERFKVLKFKRIIFTKIDETKIYGAMFNISLRERVAVSYVTDGQNVPQDMKEAKKESLIELLLSGLVVDTNLKALVTKRS